MSTVEVIGENALEIIADGNVLEIGFTVDGEVNTAANLNTGGGVGVYDSKTGPQLGFRGVKGGDGIGVAFDAPTKEIVISSESGVGLQGPITVAIDYNDVTAVDPPANNTFTSQAEVDAYLASQGATAFKHVNEFVAALPMISHPVTMNVAAGTQRPSAATTFAAAFDLGQRLILPGGSLNLVGQPPSAHTALAGPLTIQSHVPGSDAPSITFAGTPFAGQDWRGKLAVLDTTGQAVVIHDHDDSTLEVATDLSPAPTDGVTQVRITRPSTILRNSRDDASAAYPLRAVMFDNGLRSFASLFSSIQDVQIDHWGVNWAMYIFDWRGILTRVMVDHEFQRLLGVSPFGRDLQIQTLNGFAIGFDCSFHADASNMGNRFEPIVVFNSMFGVNLRGCYIANSPRSVNSTASSLLQLSNSVIENTGGANPAVWATDNAQLQFLTAVSGVRTTVKNVSGAGVAFTSRSSTRRSDNQAVRIANAAGPAVLVDRTSFVDVQDSTVGFEDGGGNGNLGIKVSGEDSTVILNSQTDVTGAAGDVQLATGPVRTYAEIQAFGPFFDDNKNSVSQQ